MPIVALTANAMKDDDLKCKAGRNGRPPQQAARPRATRALPRAASRLIRTTRGCRRRRAEHEQPGPRRRRSYRRTARRRLGRSPGAASGGKRRRMVCDLISDVLVSALSAIRLRMGSSSSDRADDQPGDEAVLTRDLVALGDLGDLPELLLHDRHLCRARHGFARSLPAGSREGARGSRSTVKARITPRSSSRRSRSLTLSEESLTRVDKLLSEMRASTTSPSTICRSIPSTIRSS